MIAHQIARQVATPKCAHETQTLGEVAENVDETPLTRQLFNPCVGDVVCAGDPL